MRSLADVNAIPARAACRLDHKQEQPQIDQIKAHGSFHEELAPSALP